MASLPSVVKATEVMSSGSNVHDWTLFSTMFHSRSLQSSEPERKKRSFLGSEATVRQYENKTAQIGS